MSTKVKSTKIEAVKSECCSSAGRKRIAFRFKAKPGMNVFLAGSFNNWDISAKKLEDKKGIGDYQALVMLSKGVYEYKFFVDGKWCLDPENPNFIKNAHGTLNSVIEVG